MKGETLFETRKQLVDLFIRDCVLEEKKDRYFFLNQTEKRFQKFLSELDHFEGNLNIESAIAINGFRGHLEIINAFKLEKSQKVFVLSTVRNMKNGIECDLNDALATLFKIGNGSIIGYPSQNPDCFFYLGEDISAQFLWKLKKRNPSS